MSTPLVSIITPVYNAERFLSKTIQSVVSQTYKNIEFILVIDQKSIDHSLEIAIAAQNSDSRIIIIQDSRALGTSENRNIGIDSSKGDFITFLDADDLWPNYKLEKQISFMLEKNITFSYTSFQRMSIEGDHFSKPIKIPELLNHNDLLKLNSVALHTVMIKRKWLGNRRFPKIFHEDFALWLDLTRDGTIIYGIREPLAYYRRVPGSRAHNKIQAAIWRWQILRRYENLPLLNAIYFFIHYALRSVNLHLKSVVN